MKNSSGSGAFARFMSGRGFYAALALCLVGAAAAAWITVDRTISSVGEREENVPVKEVADDKYVPGSSVFDVEDVGKAKEDVKIEEEKPSDSSSEASSEEDTFKFLSKKEKFSMPLDGNVDKGHSGGELVKYETLNEWRTHDGIDIEAAVGTEVKAAADGKVSKVFNDPLWGITVEIDHDGNYITIYSGLSDPAAVAVGDEVKAGDVIGTLGETNLAEIGENSHLHFAMKKDGKFIDPKEKLGLN